MDTPIVVIQGARQVGKSTLAAHLASTRPSLILSLDDPATRTFAEDDPSGFVAQANDRLLVIDEAQRAPQLVLPIKAAVDRDRRPGRFLLTGSSDLLRVRGVGDSLAGRAETVALHPFSQGELARRTTPESLVSALVAGPLTTTGKDPDTIVDAVVRGGFPVPLTRTPRRADVWFSDYVDRLTRHDARDLAGPVFSQRLGGLLRVLASQGQSELVVAKLARSAGIPERTLADYLELLETMFLTRSLPSWGAGLSGRATRRPKVALLDTGLSAQLARFSVAKAGHVGGREYFGLLLEQFVAQELSRQRAWSPVRYDLYHYRTTDGDEVDLVLELDDGRIIAIEVKSAQAITQRALDPLARLRSRLGDRLIAGVVLHPGGRSYRMHDWLHVLPINAMWEH